MCRFVRKNPDTVTIIDEHETFVYHSSCDEYYALSGAVKHLWDELPERDNMDLERLIERWIDRFENRSNELRALVYESVSALRSQGLLSAMD